MSDTDETRDPTRRDFFRYGGALAVGGAFAGCSDAIGQRDEDGKTGSNSQSGGGNKTGDNSQGGEPSKTESSSYTVSMSPMGDVTFESPPETVFTRLTHHADMAFALGRGDTITAMHAPDYYDGLWNQFVERLPGVSLDWTGLYSSWKPTKEKLYALDSDIHLADPAWITKQDNWSKADIDEIATNVSPWFGNSLSDRHAEPAAAYADGYKYYGLWEQFEIVAEAFQEQKRYEELAAVHDEVMSTIESKLPPESERPSAVMLAAADLEEIYAYTLSNPGFLTAHTQPFGAQDAFGGSVETNTVIDFETLLDGDPDVILFLGGFEPGTDLQKRREKLKSDPVASQVTAVKNDRIYPQGARYQGPILHLFQLEMTAKQLYPEQFGEWPTYTDGPYPEIPEDEQLFDRQRVADVINGQV